MNPMNPMNPMNLMNARRAAARTAQPRRVERLSQDRRWRDPADLENCDFLSWITLVFALERAPDMIS